MNAWSILIGTLISQTSSMISCRTSSVALHSQFLASSGYKFNISILSTHISVALSLSTVSWTFVFSFFLTTRFNLRWTSLMCVLNDDFWENFLKHSEHSKGFSPVCTLKWLVSRAFACKKHTFQYKIVCIYQKNALTVNDLSQIEQVCDFGRRKPWCANLRWKFKPWWLAYEALHISQLNFFRFKCVASTWCVNKSEVRKRLLHRSHGNLKIIQYVFVWTLQIIHMWKE